MKIFLKLKAFLVLINFLITVAITIVLMEVFNKHNLKFRRIWGKLQLKVLGIKLNTISKIDKDAQLLLVNHQSLLDILVFEAIHPKDTAWVAKKEIADLFFYGRILTAPKMIIIDRKQKRKSVVTLLKEGKEKIDQGRVVCMFPEGTRGNGEKLLHFKNGPKLLAEKYDLKIQPVILTNTRNIVDSQNFTAQSGEVKVCYMPTFRPSQKGENWYKDLENDMAKKLKELNT